MSQIEIAQIIEQIKQEIEVDASVDILPRLENGGFQESLLGLSLSTTRLIWRSYLTQTEVDISRD
ncbi:hypothetical protein H6G10_29405, partial [Anabaena cylindrica FACHB-170]|uniref:hypothetical protein n=1 Tax=Anabaena cylindrica TaxID=1165 RepID=UPI0016871BBD